MKKIRLMKLDERATMPKFAKQGDSGFDMYTLEDTIIKAGETKLIKKYYMMPGVGAFYGGGLNFDIIILDVKSGQSMEIGFYI